MNYKSIISDTNQTLQTKIELILSFKNRGALFIANTKTG